MGIAQCRHIVGLLTVNKEYGNEQKSAKGVMSRHFADRVSHLVQFRKGC